MVALNFMQQFAADVSNGKKRQTIREKTKAKAGCDLQLYTGQRTKSCRKLGEAVCVSVQKVVIMATGVQQQGSTFCAGYQADEFAKRDGFNDYAEMWAFFKDRANEHGEFIGQLVRW
jgi:hypothetical protein